MSLALRNYLLECKDKAGDTFKTKAQPTNPSNERTNERTRKGTNEIKLGHFSILDVVVVVVVVVGLFG